MTDFSKQIRKWCEDLDVLEKQRDVFRAADKAAAQVRDIEGDKLRELCRIMNTEMDPVLQYVQSLQVKVHLDQVISVHGDTWSDSGEPIVSTGMLQKYAPVPTEPQDVLLQELDKKAGYKEGSSVRFIFDRRGYSDFSVETELPWLCIKGSITSHSFEHSHSFEISETGMLSYPLPDADIHPIKPTPVCVRIPGDERQNGYVYSVAMIVYDLDPDKAFFIIY